MASIAPKPSASMPTAPPAGVKRLSKSTPRKGLRPLTICPASPPASPPCSSLCTCGLPSPTPHLHPLHTHQVPGARRGGHRPVSAERLLHHHCTRSRFERDFARVDTASPLAQGPLPCFARGE
ncbi:hypothetical protein K458DRAFT_92091 [Lentithecium fluviatile CBS 122367]|uniref:Uncharacterized protein n=1 Tax=Lentithecium fluviatile CBS 122367 TaxID=1168545 RepID=A0A6G1IRC9_9PLEO|nr:hypothetical protein K458DRAFT_92091 [Lentithecium fluviatile CBS 122367]